MFDAEKFVADHQGTDVYEIIELAYEKGKSEQPEPLKIDLSGYSKEDWERFRKEWENAPITVLSAQPEIVRCKDCKFASGDSRICMKFGHSPIGELDFCAWAERRTNEE